MGAGGWEVRDGIETCSKPAPCCHVFELHPLDLRGRWWGAHWGSPKKESATGKMLERGGNGRAGRRERREEDTVRKTLTSSIKLRDREAGNWRGLEGGRGGDWELPLPWYQMKTWCLFLLPCSPQPTSQKAQKMGGSTGILAVD